MIGRLDLAFECHLDLQGREDLPDFHLMDFW